MKETNELISFVPQALNVGKDIAADGKINLEDVTRALPLIFSGQTAFEGLNQVGPEQEGIGPAEKAAIRKNVNGKLTNFSPQAADDWTDAIMGSFSIYRLGLRAGKKEAEEAILRELQEKGAGAVIARLKSA